MIPNNLTNPQKEGIMQILKKLNLLSLLITAMFVISGCLTDGNDSDPEDKKPISPSDSTLDTVLEGELNPGNYKLVASNTYEIKGFFYVDSGATLSIEPGTQIKSEGKSALIVRKFGKIMAKGTKEKPIVFTSKKSTPAPGDWAGLVIFGNAPVSSTDNKLAFEADANETFGGSNVTDTSGALEYVRIEYAGYLVTADKELNGLTLGGVGSGTSIKYIQVHKGSDDAFEWFGGTVNTSYLVATEQADDGFDIDEGYKGTSQYMLQIQGKDSDYGIEAGNQARNPNHITEPNWSNITIIGKNKGKALMQLKDKVSGIYDKLLLIGDSAVGAVDLIGTETLNKFKAGTTKITNSYLSGTFSTKFLAGTDSAALAKLEASFSVVSNALNADLSAKDESVKSAGAGAIVNNNLWYKDWTVGISYSPVVTKPVPGDSVLSAVLQGKLVAGKYKMVASTTYEIKDFFYVDSGAILTIEPGTQIKSEGKSALIVRKFGKIMAKGTKEKPIVFTSKKAEPIPGDWAGIVIFGNAPVSSPDGKLAFEADANEMFGGSNASDTSGTLEYVRIEYAGFLVTADKELNGLTLGGVGSGTSIKYVQVHKGSDDAFEWFGGTVNSSYLIATEQADDGFDIDEGYKGTSQYMLQLQGKDSDYGIEAGSQARDPNHITEPNWSNITIVTKKLGKAAVQLKNNVSGTYEKMVLVGDSAIGAVDLSGGVTLAKFKAGTTKFTNSFTTGLFTNRFITGTDDSARTKLSASFVQVADALNPDLSAKAKQVVDAGAGAIVNNNFWYKEWTVAVDGKFTPPGYTEIVLPAQVLGKLSAGNYKMVASTVYELKDFVYIDSGSVLNIEPGTVIKSEGKSALIVRKGGKINAKGTKEKPIVFTSKKSDPKPGDWAGIVIFGNAPVSSPDDKLAFEADANETFGGKDSSDNSGTLEYVRIEYAGYLVTADKELNGLTLGGVGKGTTIRYVQVHKGSDDAFEWFGGTVNTSHLVATEQADDGFDIDEGYMGTSQYMIQLQGVDSDYGIEAGNQARNPNHITEPKWSNITIITKNKGKAAVQLKNNVSGSYTKMVLVGDSTAGAVELVGTTTLAKFKSGATKFDNSFVAGTYSTKFLAGSDTEALTKLESSFTTVLNALNADLSAKDAAIVSAGAGAVVGSELWYKDWTVAMNYTPIVINPPVVVKDSTILSRVLKGRLKPGSWKMVADSTYEIQDFFYVDSGAVLNIEPGTVIKSEGKSALIVRKFGKIMAVGTKEKPIVFTSKKADPKPGDWAGVVIFGNALVSSPDGKLAFEADANEVFGGPNAADNSGHLEYVRIEYGGYVVALNKELNGLTLGGVGTGTTIKYVQVHKGSDDAFEWFGGTVNSSYLIATEQADDGFDIDEGYTGTSQYMIQIQGIDSDYGIECGDKNRGGNRLTDPNWSNITVIGKKDNLGLLYMKDMVAGSWNKMVLVGNNSLHAVEVIGQTAIAKLIDGTTKFSSSFYSGTYKESPIYVGGDPELEKFITDYVTSAPDALNADLSPKNQAVINAEAGAIVDNNLWYKGWSVAMP